MHDVDMEPAPQDEPEPVNPAIEGLYRGLSDVEKAAIDAIKEAKKESVILSYRMLFVGAIFGFLGSFFVATLLRWYDAGFVLDITNEDFVIGVLGMIAFALSIFIVIYRLIIMKEMENK
jgi:hypothetical protein